MRHVLTSKEGRKYIRKELEETWRNDTLQSFTPLRFLPPQLMNYKNRVLVVDPDVFALKNIKEISIPKIEIDIGCVPLSNDLGDVIAEKTVEIMTDT